MNRTEMKMDFSTCVTAARKLLDDLDCLSMDVNIYFISIWYWRKTETLNSAVKIMFYRS